MNGLATADSHFGGGVVDPFSAPRRFWPSLAHSILATALFRCWHILLFFALWSATVCLISHYVHNLAINSALLTVFGTVLGFVISYRTTSSFERYNEGRRLWSQIIHGSRTMARTIWFHIPDAIPENPAEPMNLEQRKARALIEKKTIMNLLEGFGVSVKHYLRGEEGIFYEDLYHLVKFLPAYALPNGMGSVADFHSDMQSQKSRTSIQIQRARAGSSATARGQPPVGITTRLQSSSAPHLPLPVSSPGARDQLNTVHERSFSDEKVSRISHQVKSSLGAGDEGFLMPARMPPKYGLFDLFPFSMLVRLLTKKGKDISGKKAAKMRAKLRSNVETHNLPLEISLYLSSYIATLQTRKSIDPPASTALMNTLTSLVDALTGLERILTTPIPFSYSVHLWSVTVIYCFFLPFQIWATMKWLTIPGTTIAAFIFFGFLVAGEEIENPFGYDKNDLNMDYFTHVIIRNELRALTSTPAPDISLWAFSPANDRVFSATGPDGQANEKRSPKEWIDRGVGSMQAALSSF